ncbi:hypothetical protein [Mesorhizobium sophorae]|uniref:hypothetical protein n=1 Tax=Mesorhizobium sophorae TaxID=1300294 RepID=UPI00142E5CAF|nr:hypothetical protein [Mesorhizobium sophorae]
MKVANSMVFPLSAEGGLADNGRSKCANKALAAVDPSPCRRRSLAPTRLPVGGGRRAWSGWDCIDRFGGDDIFDRRQRRGRDALNGREGLDALGFDEPQRVAWRMIDNQCPTSAKHSS